MIIKLHVASIMHGYIQHIDLWCKPQLTINIIVLFMSIAILGRWHMYIHYCTLSHPSPTHHYPYIHSSKLLPPISLDNNYSGYIYALHCLVGVCKSGIHKCTIPNSSEHQNTMALTTVLLLVLLYTSIKTIE